MQVITFSAEDLPFRIRGKNDELIVPRRFQSADVGALLGVELKKNLAPGDLLQAQAEWLLYAPKSWFPFIQVPSSDMTLCLSNMVYTIVSLDYCLCSL
jgi:hypothetical protein